MLYPGHQFKACDIHEQCILPESPRKMGEVRLFQQQQMTRKKQDKLNDWSLMLTLSSAAVNKSEQSVNSFKQL
jgi:hypothetical protein